MNAIRKQLKRFQNTYPNLYSIMMGAAVILFVRGVIGFADLYLFPIVEYTEAQYIQAVLSYSSSLVIGLFILYANDFKLNEINKEKSLF
jgi:hypothetical protein